MGYWKIGDVPDLVKGSPLLALGHIHPLGHHWGGVWLMMG